MTSQETAKNSSTAGSSGGRLFRNVLVLANRLPYPLDDGWKVRTFHIIRSVATVADVTLLIFDDGDEERRLAAERALGQGVRILSMPAPRAYTPRNLLLGLASRTPVHIWNLESSEMKDEVRQQVAALAPEVVLSESTFMFRYLRDLPEGTLRVVDTHNVDSVTFGRYAATLRAPLKRWYARLTARKLHGFEQWTYRNSDLVWVCSDDERRIVAQMAPGCNVWTVPNGVDTEVMKPLPGIRPEPRRLLFFGRMNYYPNVDGLRYFIEQIFPLLEHRVPGVELQVVGPDPTPEVHRLAERHPAVRLLGGVEDLAPVLASAAVVIVPLRVGGGTRLKIIEALSAARPVVATTIGAEGLEVRRGQDLLIEDDPAGFANAIQRLLSDPALASGIGQAGRETVRERYDWAVAGREIAASFTSVVRNGA